MTRAIDLLPPELKPFFVKHRDEIVVRVVDPDTWRVAGWPENAHHFLDFGVPEYGTFPFDELPREYDVALQKFGARRSNETDCCRGAWPNSLDCCSADSRLPPAVALWVDRRGPVFRVAFPPSRTPISRSTAPTTTTAS